MSLLSSPFTLVRETLFHWNLNIQVKTYLYLCVYTLTYMYSHLYTQEKTYLQLCVCGGKMFMQKDRMHTYYLNTFCLYSSSSKIIFRPHWFSAPTWLEGLARGALESCLCLPTTMPGFPMLFLGIETSRSCLLASTFLTEPSPHPQFFLFLMRIERDE